MKCNV